MNQVIDFSTLTWVKNELDETLKEARRALEAHVENSEDEAQLEVLAAHLHQVYGTLQMVELYGAALLTEEMEQVARAMGDGSVNQRDEAREVLMRAILQLPDYLDRLISGYRDVPLVLLPLLNDLRAVRGENLLSENAMFNPDLAAALPQHVCAGGAQEDSQNRAKELRHRFQLGLLGWFRGKDPKDSLSALLGALEGLQELGGDVTVVRLWWAAAGLLDALIAGSLGSSVALKRVLGQVDREIKRLLDEGESALIQAPREDLFKNLLFYCAQPPATTSERIGEIQATYRLRELLPDEEEMTAARQSMSGRNSDLFATVAVAVKEELARLKDSLDMILRNGCGDGRELEPLTDALRKLGDTLGMLGLGAARKAVVAKADDLQQLTASGSAPADTALMDVASTLLLVESSVDNMGSGRAVAEDDGQAEAQLARNEYSQVMDVVIQEAIADLIRAKEAIVGYTESEHDVALIEEVPQWFNQVKGGMLLLGETRPASLVDAIARYIRTELIDNGKQAQQHELEALAESICGLEYYLESRREHRMYGGSAIAVAEQGVERLGYPADETLAGEQVPTDATPVQTVDEAGAAAPADADAQEADVSDSIASPGDETDSEAFEFDFSLLDDAQPESGDGIEIPVMGVDMSLEEESVDAAGPLEDEPVEMVAAQEEAAAEESQDLADEGGSPGLDAPVVGQPDVPAVEAEDDGLAIIGDEVDEEILEIFIEEAEEELACINEQLPAWLANTDNADALGTMRRSWHTLKGSGRLVGAMRIGEFAWAFENMLNRVIDGTLSVDPELKSLMGSAAEALPELVEQVKHGTPTTLPIGRLMRHADALSKGEVFTENGPDLVESGSVVDSVDSDESVGIGDIARDEQEEVQSADEAAQDWNEFIEPDSAPDAVHVAALEPESDGEVQVEQAGQVDAEPDNESVMDSQLFEIFNTESRSHLDVVRRFLDSLEQGDEQVDESVLRAMHTLHGSAHMADADAIAELAGGLEKLLKVLMSSGQMVDATVRDVLEESVASIEAMLSGLPRELPVPEDYEAILQRVADLCSSVPAVSSGHPADVLSQDSWIDSDYDVTAVETGLDAFHSEETALSDDDGEQLAGLSEQPEATEYEVPGVEELDELRVEEMPESDPDAASFEEQEAAESPIAAENDESFFPEESGEDTGNHYAGHDEELLEIFLEEAGENLEVADAALGNWRVSADDESALAELQRALHTLKGGARMADLPAIGDIAHAVESLIITISENRPADAGAAIDSVQQAQDCLAGMLDRVRRREPVERADELVALLNAQQEQASHRAVAEPLEALQEDAGQPQHDEPAAVAVDAYSEVDPELLEVFIEEASDIMEHCEQTLQNWKRARDDQDLMAELQRELHTLKGGARMADITEIGDLAHAVESLMVKAAAGEVVCSDSLFHVLERAQDRLNAMVDKVRNHESLDEAADIVGDLEKLRDGLQVDTAAIRAPEQRKDESAATTGVAVAPDGEHEERRSRSRTSQELIRVKADLLDNMVNYAGEVSIYRSRLEQQIGAYSFNLVEMEQTVARVREQLRKLEIETEAQVLYRYEREGEVLDEAEGGEDFDPLEMDRYSHMQQLSRSLMESVSDLNSIQNLLENITRESETLLLQQSRVNTELQEGLMRTRMVPFLSLAARMRRIVRQTAQELGKKAELELSGAEGEMDRTVVDRIVAPLEHMLRNAISHGIETPEQRIAKGKSEGGTIRITLERESSDVVLRIADDGAGISIEAIRKKAIQRGLMEADAELTDTEVLQFILETGFSTAEKVTQVAGRGVGMDVVNSEVKQLGGSLHIDSQLGSGTTFTIRLPFTLALNQALLVEVGEDTYAIPLSSIEGIVRMRREDLKAYYDDPEARFEYGGYAYEVRHLGSVLGTGTPHLDSGAKRMPMLLARFGEHCVAFHVENLLGSREIVVKSVGPQISTVPGVSGATILGDGRVVMILEVAALLRGGALAGIGDQVQEVGRRSTLADQGLTVMVVDDSITVRKVTTRILERNDMHVIAAKDGVDAVSKLQENIPDIMLLDIEMPRMDGFELATHVRNEARLRDIPIIMITSRTGDKHRQRAMQIGVNRYLGKPFQESELLENIQALLEETALDA